MYFFDVFKYKFFFIICCKALAWEGDYEMHPVHACVPLLVCRSDFSETTAVTLLFL